jgi:hypothetical protein
VKASGAAKVGHLKNLIWTSLKFSRPCGTYFGNGRVEEGMAEIDTLVAQNRQSTL